MQSAAAEGWLLTPPHWHRCVQAWAVCSLQEGLGAVHNPQATMSLGACPKLCASGRCLLQIRAEVEVQLAAQVRQAQAEQRRAAKEAARLEQQLQQQSAQVQRVAARKEQAQAHK